MVPKSALQGGEEALVCVRSLGRLPRPPHTLDDAQPAPQGWVVGLEPYGGASYMLLV